MTDYLCLLTMSPDLCWYCGEWVHVEGGDLLHDSHLYCGEGCIVAEHEDRVRSHARQFRCAGCGNLHVLDGCVCDG